MLLLNKNVSLRFFQFFIALLFSCYFVSCKPVQKLPDYLETITDSTGKGDVLMPELKIQKNDQLSIQIYSESLAPDKSDIIYNQPSTSKDAASTTGYFVDRDGNIEHHRLGVIHAEGLTKKELANVIKQRLTEPVELLTNPTVLVRFLNFKVNVLGEVTKEGPINVPGDRVTIFDAIGLAGGITQFGKKNNVKVIRELNGKRETAIVDLTSDKVFESPFYNLVQNDVLIIEPTNQRMRDAEQARVAQKISLAFTIVTVAATLANIFIK